MRFLGKLAVASTIVGASLALAPAAFADTSPTLLIESAPSDNPNYRRMIYVKYLQGNKVSASYKAYNRREFVRTPVTTPDSVIKSCASGKATSLRDIRKFQKDEAQRDRSGLTPTPTTFCIKGISNWTDKNKDIYLDPIFDSMPYVRSEG